MKTSLIIFAGTLCLLWTASEVIANPAMLPKHEGYPMGKATDPVSGQSLANDPGQTNATGERSLREAALFGDTALKQNLINENDQRVLQKPGAGLLPKVQGPDITIVPPVQEATKVNASPE
jgi:hypothetical protein